MWILEKSKWVERRGLCPRHQWVDTDGTIRGNGVLRDDRDYCIVCYNSWIEGAEDQTEEEIKTKSKTSQGRLF